jgi:hypothetical protein
VHAQTLRSPRGLPAATRRDRRLRAAAAPPADVPDRGSCPRQGGCRSARPASAGPFGIAASPEIRPDSDGRGPADRMPDAVLALALRDPAAPWDRSRFAGRKPAPVTMSTVMFRLGRLTKRSATEVKSSGSRDLAHALARRVRSSFYEATLKTSRRQAAGPAECHCPHSHVPLALITTRAKLSVHGPCIPLLAGLAGDFVESELCGALFAGLRMSNTASVTAAARAHRAQPPPWSASAG